jgi:acyl-coenzyme A thioesterase PaaI-like protein
VSQLEENRALRDAAAVEPLGPGRYGAHLSRYFTIPGGYPNGGYLQCVMANGALAAASAEGSHHLHTTSITTNYIGAPIPGPAELVCDVRRIGRGVSFVHVALFQEGQMVTESLVTLGNLHEDSTARYIDAPVPDVAPLEECLRSRTGDEITMGDVLDGRLDPSCVGWMSGEISERGEVKGWLRLDDGDASWDAWSILLATDGMVPGTFPLGSSGWVPTLQLTSYVRRIPTSEWLRARQWCIVIADGVVDERCELFDERGELVASSSQIAMVRFPSAH